MNPALSFDQSSVVLSDTFYIEERNLVRKASNYFPFRFARRSRLPINGSKPFVWQLGINHMKKQTGQRKGTFFRWRMLVWNRRPSPTNSYQYRRRPAIVHRRTAQPAQKKPLIPQHAAQPYRYFCEVSACSRRPPMHSSPVNNLFIVFRIVSRTLSSKFSLTQVRDTLRIRDLDLRSTTGGCGLRMHTGDILGIPPGFIIKDGYNIKYVRRWCWL